MDNQFQFAQYVADAAYEYEARNGGPAARSYHEVFNLIMHRDEIEKAYGKVMAIYGLTTCPFSQEFAEDAMALLDKPLGQQPYAELRTPRPDQAQVDAKSAETLYSIDA